MFTGLVEAVGHVQRLTRTGTDAKIFIDNPFGTDLALGDSVAVNGACLTVVEFDAQFLAAQASQETLSKTNLKALRQGTEVNLERALQVGARLGGHWVLGHVDGTGTLVSKRTVGQAIELRIKAPSELMPLIVSKGSIAVDGVSLTVNEVSEDSFTLTLIPFTQKHIALLERPMSWPLNLETDILGKYVARMLGKTQVKPGLTMEKLTDFFS